MPIYLSGYALTPVLFFCMKITRCTVYRKKEWSETEGKKGTRAAFGWKTKWQYKVTTRQDVLPSTCIIHRNWWWIFWSAKDTTSIFLPVTAYFQKVISRSQTRPQSAGFASVRKRINRLNKHRGVAAKMGMTADTKKNKLRVLVRISSYFKRPNDRQLR